MNIQITDTCITLGEGVESFLLFEKPALPNYQNVTARPYISIYLGDGATIWSRLQVCTELLADFCHEDPYYACYTLLFRRLYPLLLSSSQAKNVVSYGLPADCGAHKVLQDFMHFLHEGNALTALPQSTYAYTTLKENSFHAFLYCLDAFPSLFAVCDAISKVRPGGLVLLYTIKETLPAELNGLCAHAEKDCFAHCMVYTLTVDGALSEFACANGSEPVILSRAEEVLKRVGDLKNLVQAMLTGSALPGDAYFIAVVILQQTEQILLSVYDYLENDELPVRANILKESVLNYYVGISRQCDLTSYREKLTESSETFFAAIAQEFD